MRFFRVFLAAISIYMVLSSATFAQQPYDSIAVKISNRVITLNEIRLSVGQTIKQLELQKADVPDQVVLTREIINSLIENNLLELEADQFNIKLTTEQLDERVQRFMDGNKMDASTFEEYLKNSGLTITEFKRRILAENKRNQVLSNFVRSKINIEEEETRNYFEENYSSQKSYTISHILRSVPAGGTDEEWAKAEEEAKFIKSRIETENADFGDLVLEYSQDPSAKDNNGQLAPFKVGEILPELEKEVLSMNEGEVRAPVKTRFGYHVVRLDKVDVQSNNNYDTAKDKVFQEIYNKKFIEIKNEYIEELKEKYKVEIRNKEVAAILEESTTEAG